MQVWSRQRGVSLIEVRQQANAGGRPFECATAAACRSRHAGGFTVVELMITVTIAVVLIMIAVPSFKTITLSSKLTTTANDIVGAINIARMEAIKRNANTQLCGNTGNTSNSSDTLGLACTTQTGAVYVLINAAAVPVRDGTNGISAPIVLTGNMTPVRFGGQGLGHLVASTAPYSGLIADISTAAISTDNHRCIRMTAGSIITTTPSSAACPP